MKVLEDPIWNTRLQVGWIAFAGIYSAAVDPLQVVPKYFRSPIISILCIIGSALIVSALVHTMAQEDRDRTARLHLVIFGALAYMMATSLKLKDYSSLILMASWALILCLIMCASIDEHLRYLKLKFLLFSIVASSAVCGSIGFSAGVILHFIPTLRIHTCIGLDSAGAYLGIPVGAALAGNLLRIDNFENKSIDLLWRYVLKNLLLYSVVCGLLAAALATDDVRARWGTGGAPSAALVSGVVGLTLAASMLWPLCGRLRRAVGGVPNDAGMLGHLLALGLLGGCLHGVVVVLLRLLAGGRPFFPAVVLSVECISGVVLGLAVYVAYVMVFYIFKDKIIPHFAEVDATVAAGPDPDGRGPFTAAPATAAAHEFSPGRSESSPGRAIP